MTITLEWKHAAALLALALALGLAVSPGNAPLAQSLTRQAVPCPVPTISAMYLANLIASGKKGITVIDVRPDWQFQDYHIPGAISVPAEQMRMGGRLPVITGEIVVCSTSAEAASTPAAILEQRGFRVSVMAGGMTAWWVQVMSPATLAAPEGDLAAHARAASSKSLRDNIWERGMGGKTPPVVAPAAPAIPVVAPPPAVPSASPVTAPAPAGKAKVPGATC